MLQVAGRAFSLARAPKSPGALAPPLPLIGELPRLRRTAARTGLNTELPAYGHIGQPPRWYDR